METPTAVLRQRCALTVDTATCTISGWVEVTVALVEGQSNVNLYAQGLKIQGVQMDEAPLAWGVSEPSVNPIPEAWKKDKVNRVRPELGKLSFLQYKHLRECTQHPNLCIKLPMVVTAESSKECTLKIHYSVENPTGVRFEEGCAFVRGGCFDLASTWMPCNPLNPKPMTLDLEISVHPAEIVICSGKLLQTLPDEARKLKTFHYRLVAMVSLSQLFLCVGRFEVYSCPIHNLAPDSSKMTQSMFVSCFGLKGTANSMEYTMKFFPTVFRYIEEILQTSFPFETLKVLFLPDVTPVAAGWHDCITLSSTLLLPSKSAMDHGLHHRLAVCLGLLRVWFGAVVTPKTPADNWLTEGLVGWIEHKLIGRLVGVSELCHRKQQQHVLICEEDNGSLPPLFPKDGSPELLGTEWYHCQDAFRCKATAVMRMIEQRVSHEAFKRVIERLVGCAADVCRSEAPSTKRLIATRSFLKEVGQAGGIRKEIQAFAERWVYGSGCPTITTEVGFDSKTFSLLLSLKQEGSKDCMKATAAAVKMSKDGSIGLVKVSVAEAASTANYTVQLGAEESRDVRFKLHGRPRKRRRMESTVSITENQSPVKWVRVNPDHALLGTMQITQNEEMWSAMLEESKDVAAESEAVAGLLSLESGALSICKTLEVFIRSSAYCRVRMEAIMALAQITSQENAYEGLSFLTEFYRSRRFDRVTGLPKPNAFTDFSELLVDQTIPLALGSMKDSDGYTPKEAIELILQVLEFNDNEGNDFDDAEWIAAWIAGLEKVVVKEEEWRAVFKVLDRYLGRDRLFPSRQQIVTQACLSVLRLTALHQSLQFKSEILPLLAKYVDPLHYEPKTRAIAAQAMTQISASIHGPDVAIFNALNWLLEETSVIVRESMFRSMTSLILLIGAKGRGNEGIQWRTIELLYNSMVNPSLEGTFRHHCLLMLLAISDEPFSLYRPRSEGRPRPEFKNPAKEGEPSQVTEAVDAGKKLKVKIKT